MVASPSKDREYSFMGKLKVAPPKAIPHFGKPKLDEGEFGLAKTENRKRIVNAIQQLQ